MCGINGILAAHGLADLADVARRMADTLTHRGPDDAGVWADKEAGIALGHRRLSIVDLSPAGHQPMVSATSRYVIVFNGEIYNHHDLRQQLQQAGHAPSWRGHSDTETLLAACEIWGIEGALRRMVGMFAIALWDRGERLLTLARDRLGEKPLYYGLVRGVLLFGSELKALKAFPGFSARIDRSALALYMRHNYVPAPRSIYEGIHKLPAGHFVQFRVTGRSVEGTEPAPFWSARQAADAGLRDPFNGDENEARVELERLLSQSIAGQMFADVPLGAFLSGGIDSSVVVALMQAQSSRPVKTFTIGFSEGEYNEAQHAMAVARHLGCEHTELYVTPQQALDVIPRLPALYDEPFADSSQVPTYLVSALARRHVTVSLSGDGGDELSAATTVTSGRQSCGTDFSASRCRSGLGQRNCLLQCRPLNGTAFLLLRGRCCLRACALEIRATS
jgi:asparagine synthase (glutamine-hydrolysing)